MCCSVYIILHIGCMFVCELQCYVNESTVRLHIFWSHPPNWGDFIDFTHIPVGVHPMVHDALGFFVSLNVSSASVLYTMYSLWLVLVHLSLCGYPVCLVSVTMLGSTYNCCVYQHVWMCGCCIIDPVLEVHPPCGVVCSWLVSVHPSSFVNPVHVVRRPCIPVCLMVAYTLAV